MFDRVLDEAGAASVIPLIRILTQFVGGVDAVCLVAPLAVGDLNPGVAWYGKGTALFAVRVHREDHDAVGATRCVIRLVAPDVQAEVLALRLSKRYVLASASEASYRKEPHAQHRPRPRRCLSPR